MNAVVYNSIRNNLHPFISPAKRLENHADGNMLSHNGWSLSRDGENRMIRAEKGANFINYTYDALNRRVSEISNTKETYFVWDRNNLFSEVYMIIGDAIPATPPSINYVWGLDMSGTLQGAGGVGGLLYQYASSAAMQTEQSFPFYDNNGNITMYIKPDYTLGAYYNYDAFLNGCQGDQYRFQASTKSWNPDLSLLEYQFRAYSPTLGRWIQEDPIQEQGGINLYNFVNNNPITNWDNLGWGYFLLLYDSADPIFEKWANAVEKKIKSDSITYFGARVKFDNDEDEFIKIPVASVGSFDELLNYQCVEYFASFGHGSNGKIWWDYDKKGNSIVTGIQGYKTSAKESIDMSLLAKIDFVENAVIEFYHCNTGKQFNVDNNGDLTFSYSESQKPDAPSNARESILTYYKKLLKENSDNSNNYIYGSPGGISNGYPGFRGYPRPSGGEKKTTAYRRS